MWWNASAHGGVDGIDQALRGLEDGLAGQIRGRVDAGDDAGLMIVQCMDGTDPSGSLGIALGAEAVGWLARAGASLQVDQYAELVVERDEIAEPGDSAGE